MVPNTQMNTVPYGNMTDEEYEKLLHTMYPCVRQFIRYSEKNKEPFLWVFGYGSLVWLPKFDYQSSVPGYIKGYARRFWQGNSTHRGVPGSPGRVATLIEDANDTTWGCAFLLQGYAQITGALKHLCCREMNLGGYDVKSIEFYGRKGEFYGKSVPTLTFVATPESKQYLGPAPIENMAETIVNASGKSGHNLEYVFRLAEALREIGPDTVDPHLASLVMACLKLTRKKYGRRPETFTEDEGYPWNILSEGQELQLMCRMLASQRSDVLNHHTFCNSMRAN